MKTISKFFGLVAAIAALAACNKEVNPAEPVVPEGMQKVSLTVNASNPTKVTMDWQSGDFAWNIGSNEQIAAVFQKDGEIAIYKFENDGNSGDRNHFEGAVDARYVGTSDPLEYLTDVFYPYDELLCSTLEDYQNYKYWNGGRQYGQYEDQLNNDLAVYPIPLHWNKSIHGSEDDGSIKLRADRYSMLKISPEDLSGLFEIDVNTVINVKGLLHDRYGYDTPYETSFPIYVVNGDVDNAILIEIPFDSEGRPQTLVGATFTLTKDDGSGFSKGCFHTSFDEDYGCKPIEAGKRYNLKPYYYFCNYGDQYNDQEHAPFVVITDEMLQDKGSDKSISTITWGEFLNLGILEGPYSLGEGYNEEENAVIYDDYYVLVYDQNEYNAVTSDDLLCNTNGLMFY